MIDLFTEMNCFVKRLEKIGEMMENPVEETVDIKTDVAVKGEAAIKQQ